jgi:hypothetical protein
VIHSDVFDEQLEIYYLPKVLRILGYVRRFVSNCKLQTEEKVTGPVYTDEVEQRNSGGLDEHIKQAKMMPNFEQINGQLNGHAQRVRKDEQFHSLLASFGIKWRFNLSLAPWWWWLIRETYRLVQECVLQIRR